MKQKTYLQKSIRNLWDLLLLLLRIKKKRVVRIERHLEKDLTKTVQDIKEIVKVDTYIQRLNQRIRKLSNQVRNNFHSQIYAKLKQALNERYVYTLVGSRGVKIFKIGSENILAINERNALRKYKNIKKGLRQPFDLPNDLMSIQNV